MLAVSIVVGLEESDPIFTGEAKTQLITTTTTTTITIVYFTLGGYF